MKTVLLIMVLGLTSLLCFPQTNPNSHYQRGYVKKDCSYVKGHYKTNKNNTNRDNYTTTPNTNSHTGKRGSTAQDYSPGAYNYGKGKTIQTGPKGGQYFKNSKGNKTYVPKRK